MKACLFIIVGILIAVDSQYPGRRCPHPSRLNTCRTSCTPRNRPCERGSLCCRTSCDTYVCVGGGIPPWCPVGSPRIQCFVNPCQVMRCPRFRRARCINDNPCEPSCSGNFYYRGRRVSQQLCYRRTRRDD